MSDRAGERADAIPVDTLLACLDPELPLTLAALPVRVAARLEPLLRAAQPGAGSEEAERELRLAAETLHNIHRGSAGASLADCSREDCRRRATVLARAAHPEADRAPEGHAVGARCACGHVAEQHDYGTHECRVEDCACRLFVGPEADRAPGQRERDRALNDYMAEHGPNAQRRRRDAERRDDTVTLAEHLRVRASHTDGQTRQTWLEAADVVARFGAGRAEAETDASSRDRAPSEVETVARALHDAVCEHDWDRATDAHREAYLGYARAALDAVRGRSRDDTVPLAEVAEVTVARAIAAETRCHDYDVRVDPMREARTAIAALDAVRGRSRDDTVALSEVREQAARVYYRWMMSDDYESFPWDDDNTPSNETKREAETFAAELTARFGAGRAEDKPPPAKDPTQ